MPGASVSRRTADFIGTLEAGINFYSHNLFQVYPGAPIFDSHERHGLKLFAYGNGIHYKTIYPFDTTMVEPAPKSNVVTDAVTQDKANILHLALSLSGKSDPDFVNRVIFTGAIITEELVAWLQKNLAVNGKFIQVYPDLESAGRFYRQNEDAMRSYISPTNLHAVYYQSEKAKGKTRLIPYRFHILGPRCGFPLDMVETAEALTGEDPSFDSSRTACIDNPGKKEDAVQLYRLLETLNEEKANFDALLDHPVYPYFAGLCRWEKGPANCHTLETVLIDEEYHIKTCWNGSAIGNMGTPLAQVKEGLDRLHRDTGEMKCIFPAPLSPEEYRSLKQKGGIEEAADLLRTFDLFKEMQI
jgi:hypothetical protein